MHKKYFMVVNVKNPKIEKKLIYYIKSNNDHNSLYWYPLVNVAKFIPVAAYDIVRIYQDNNIFFIENVVKLCNIKDVIMFQMDYREYFENESITQLLYEQDKDGYIFQWYAETFIFDKSEEWLIYLSHENTISFTGEKIVTVAKQVIPPYYLIV